MKRAIQNYLELHRHAIVRVALLRDPACAFRLMVAHAMAPTGNWRVQLDKQRARSPEIRESIATSPAQALFDAEREAGLWADDDADAPDAGDVEVINPGEGR